MSDFFEDVRLGIFKSFLGFPSILGDFFLFGTGYFWLRGEHILNNKSVKNFSLGKKTKKKNMFT